MTNIKNLNLKPRILPTLFDEDFMALVKTIIEANTTTAKSLIDANNAALDAVFAIMMDTHSDTYEPEEHNINNHSSNLVNTLTEFKELDTLMRCRQEAARIQEGGQYGI